MHGARLLAKIRYAEEIGISARNLSSRDQQRLQVECAVERHHRSDPGVRIMAYAY